MHKGTIHIDRYQVTSNDPSFKVKGAALVRFTNHGTTRVWIDEDEVIDPGESFTEADDSGGGITHSYKIDFLTLSSPPSADSPLIVSGNHLHIRVHKRDTDA